MADCEALRGCAFFNDRMDRMSAVAEIYKQNYCRNDSSRCARMMVRKAFGGERVPGDLFPNQVEIAEEMIRRR